MKTTDTQLTANILTFSQRYVEQYQEKLQHLPLVEHDEQWPSPCLQNKFDEKLMCWQPVEMQPALSFANLEDALDLVIHPSIVHYFTTIFSENIPASCSEGHLQLLFAWSEDDFARLQENLIGHVLMKQKLKQTVTLFFAVTDDDNIMLTVENESGEVWAERVGCKPHKKIADSLTDFIASLQPDIYIEPETD
ncbi:SecY-interacting protein [Thalassotalea castellviae]|uniref:Protein Syd n=1 Tax=Thalassotalea castellviae TaxID=3075612 RepID=A0ABU2ZWI2_9GAMM|nr:SecY-interacting protein [Thalassotalea sp. W431]MDT0602286.1 SecY-interacting protein [Thalassotalea sp. W431]